MRSVCGVLFEALEARRRVRSRQPPDLPRQPPHLALAAAGAPRASERKPRARLSERKRAHLAPQRQGGPGGCGFGLGLRGCWWYRQLQPGGLGRRHAAQQPIARR
eukprot:scaffold62302_cov39-Phaeocystis_antarctica.AAC.1